METTTIITALGIFLIIIGGIGFGWFLNELITTKIPQEKEVYALGLYMEYQPNWTSAMNEASNYDAQGDWIAINLRGLSFEESKRVVEHELAHEIFARYCSKNENFDKCMNLTSS